MIVRIVTFNLPGNIMQVPQFEIHAALEQTHWWFTARRQIVRRLIETLIYGSTEASIVEIGCGTGGNIAALSKDYSCLGIDIDPEAIRHARRRFPQLQLICGTAPQDITLDLQKASIVLLLDVLEHVEDDFRMLSEILSAMRPGGFLILTVPAGVDLWTEHDNSFGHFRRYDKDRLEATWTGLAVTSLLCSYFNSRLYAPIKWMRRANQRLHRTSGHAGTDFSQPPAIINSLLHFIFSSESAVLSNSLRTTTPTGFRRGISLITVLRREQQRTQVRSKPAWIARDQFNPTLIRTH